MQPLKVYYIILLWYDRMVGGLRPYYVVRRKVHTNYVSLFLFVWRLLIKDFGRVHESKCS